MKRLGIQIVILLSSSLTFADQCDDLSINLCGNLGSPVEDHTGFAAGDRSDSYRRELADSHRPQIEDAAKQIVANLEKAGKLVDVLPNVSRRYPECQNVEGSVPPACRATLEKSIRYMLWDKIARTNGSKPESDWSTRPDIYDFTRLYPGRSEEIISNLVKTVKEREIAKPINETIKTKLFPDVRKQIDDLLPSIFTNDNTLKEARARLNAIKGIETRCDDSGNSDNMERFSANDAVFDRKTGMVRLCQGRIQNNTSLYSLVQLIAHEVSHSFDPCNLQLKDGHDHSSHNMFNRQQNWNKNNVGANFVSLGLAERKSTLREFISCLRDEKSLGAVNLASKYPDKSLPVICRDQVSEGFADLIAVEVLASFVKKNYFAHGNREEAVAGIKNAMRAQCAAKEPPEFVSHKPTRNRANAFLLTHPTIRNFLGCRPLDTQKQRYCGILKEGSQIQQKESTPSRVAN